MLDKVKVVYGLSVSDQVLSAFVNRVFAIKNAHRCDCVLHIQSNHIEVDMMPFSYNGAKQISEKEGSEILQSLVHLFENSFKDSYLWDASLVSSLPF